MTRKKLPLLFGTDPELFSTYEKNGALFTLPPYFFRKYLGVPASKDEKHPVFIETSDWKLHEDGAAFEMSISPSFSADELFQKIHDCKSAGEAEIISKYPEYCMPILQFLPTVGFDVERWKNEGEEFKMATMFGCDPDIDAFNFEQECGIIDASQHPQRYGGGHIHISGSKLFTKEPILAIQCLALTAGLCSIKMSDTPELDKARTFLYGRPGKFRIQKYSNSKFGEDYSVGIEYRTPSNRWANSLDSAREIYKWAEIGVRNLLETKLGLELVEEFTNETIDAIINCNQSLASELLAEVENRI